MFIGYRAGVFTVISIHNHVYFLLNCTNLVFHSLHFLYFNKNPKPKLDLVYLSKFFEGCQSQAADDIQRSWCSNKQNAKLIIFWRS